MPTKESGSLIRKLRKKLRQIENLSRCNRELTSEEQNKIDSKDIIRSELQELLEEEQTMVELTETVKTSSVEDNLKDDTDMANHQEQLNGHHVPTPVGRLLDMDENRDIIVTDDPPPQVQNGFHTEEEKVIKEIVQEENVVEVQNAMETEEPVQEVTEVKGTEEAQKLRRSTRERKPNRNVAKDTSLDLFKDMNLKSFALEGHHHDICSVDMFQTFAVSGGRDTSLKVWDSFSKEESVSLGGHDGTITCVRFMADRSFEKIPPVLTSSLDCSLRIWNMDEGKMTRSIYVYSPVICMDYLNGLIAIGLEGGKVEVYGVEGGDQQFTVNAYEDAVTSVKFLDSERVACGSTNGVVKIYNIASVDEKEPIFTLTPDNVKVFNKHEAGSKPYDSQTSSTLNMSKVTCIETWNDLVLYGDSGYNIKVLDYQKGELTKVRNNLKEFCPTETLHVGSIQSKQFLFSVGSDVDNGDAYINIRSLPDLQYLGTIRDIETNSGSVTSLALQEIDERIHFVTGGSQLRVWNQVTRRGRKRKGSPNGDLPYVPCKYICNFTDPRDSEPESDNETETETESSPEQSTERIPAGSSNSWCNIL